MQKDIFDLSNCILTYSHLRASLKIVVCIHGTFDDDFVIKNAS